MEYHVERLMREAKVILIYESTSEIQKNSYLAGFTQVNCIIRVSKLCK